MFDMAKAFSSFSVDDLEKAKKFYGETLGIKVVDRPEGLELHLTDDNKVFIYPKPNHIPATFTILNFPVDDVEETIGQLRSRGIRSEHYDDSNIKTNSKGILRSQGFEIAWFKDPAGNIVSVLAEKL